MRVAPQPRRVSSPPCPDYWRRGESRRRFTPPLALRGLGGWVDRRSRGEVDLSREALAEALEAMGGDPGRRVVDRLLAVDVRNEAAQVGRAEIAVQVAA